MWYDEVNNLGAKILFRRRETTNESWITSESWLKSVFVGLQNHYE